jgi:arylsulfatase A-like enzyme
VSARASVILITVDCLRADHVGFMGYRRPTTPFLDSIAAESLVFPRAIVAGAPTYYSFPGIMASRFPLALGRDVIGIAPAEPTLATVLHDHGYRTGALVAANPYLSRRFGYDQGFEVFEDFLSLDASQQSKSDNTPSSGIRTRVNAAMAKLTRSVGPLKRLYDDTYFEYCQRIALHRQTSWDELRRYPSADVLVSRACEWIE